MKARRTESITASLVRKRVNRRQSMPQHLITTTPQSQPPPSCPVPPSRRPDILSFIREVSRSVAVSPSSLLAVTDSVYVTWWCGYRRCSILMWLAPHNLLSLTPHYNIHLHSLPRCIPGSLVVMSINSVLIHWYLVHFLFSETCLVFF